jgi:hypothetical protein
VGYYTITALEWDQYEVLWSRVHFVQCFITQDSWKFWNFMKYFEFFWKFYKFWNFIKFWNFLWNVLNFWIFENVDHFLYIVWVLLNEKVTVISFIDFAGECNIIQLSTL